jgi:hypothetical protein
VNGYAVVYAAESDPTEIVMNMIRMEIEAENFIESGALSIIKRESLYSIQQTGLDAHNLLDSFHSIILKLKRSNFKGIVAIGAADVFTDTNNQQKLVEYEQIIGKKFNMPLETVCCYNSKSIDSLSLTHLILILNSHRCTIHDGWVYREWHIHRLTKVVGAGLDRSLGNMASKLVFQTLKLVYNLDGNSIIDQPQLFVDIIRKMFKNSADSILQAIKDEIKKEIVIA